MDKFTERCNSILSETHYNALSEDQETILANEEMGDKLNRIRTAHRSEIGALHPRTGRSAKDQAAMDLMPDADSDGLVEQLLGELELNFERPTPMNAELDHDIYRYTGADFNITAVSMETRNPVENRTPVYGGDTKLSPMSKWSTVIIKDKNDNTIYTGPSNMSLDDLDDTDTSGIGAETPERSGGLDYAQIRKDVEAGKKAGLIG